MRNPSLTSPAGGTTRVSKTTPCCSKIGLKRGPWTAEEDDVLACYIKKEGEGRWRTLPKRAGLLRCGKSCRLRWMNYLRPCVKRGHITPDEEDLILRLHTLLGNKWSLIAGRIPGRTDNEIKNYWNTHLSKKLINQGIDPRTHKPLSQNPDSSPTTPTFQHPSSSKLSDYPLIGNLTDTTDEFASGAIQADDVFLGDRMNLDLQKNDIIIGSYGDGGEEDDAEVEAGTSRRGMDDVFSSFLNSLINEDQEVGKHQIDEHNALNMSSSAAQAFGLHPNWETDVMGSSGLQINNLQNEFHS